MHHPPVFEGFDDIELLEFALAGEEGLRDLHRDADVLRVFFGVPHVHDLSFSLKQVVATV